MPQWPKFVSGTDRRVLDILHSGKMMDGPYVPRLEQAFARFVGRRSRGDRSIPVHTIAVANGTCALECAFTALGIGAGDEVICTPYSFIASSFSIMLAGAQPVFCDVGMDHMIDIGKAEALVNRRTKAILVVHLFGIVADMGPIVRFAKRHGLKVVEDCAQCLGGAYKGQQVGTIGDAGCYSFCQSKHVTTGGEGGMVVVKSASLAERVRKMRAERQYGMTEIQAAIGLGEFARIKSWNLPRRRQLGRALIIWLKSHPLVKACPPDSEERRNAFWLVPFVLKTELLDCSGFQFVQEVQAEGVGAYAVLWPEMYNEGAYVNRRGLGPKNAPFGDPKSRKIDYTRVDCPVARSLTENVIGFWTHPTYYMRDVIADIRAFKKVADRHMKKSARDTGA